MSDGGTPLDALVGTIGTIFNAGWYNERYPDVARNGIDPLLHFIRHGIEEGRDPNRHFDSAWYRARYPDVAVSGMNPLLHYLRSGAAELRNPGPGFDAAYYAEQNPQARNNPLLHYLRVGEARRLAIERPLIIADYLPAAAGAAHVCPPGIHADVIIPVYRGLAQTRRCIRSVLADPDRPPGRIIVIDDCSPEPKLSAWLDTLHRSGRIQLVRNRRNLGFVASVNRGMALAAPHDVALLNSDTETPPGWLRRLAGHAHAAARIASVSPFSNNATICSWPGPPGGPLAKGATVAELDAACLAANAGRHVALPTTVGFCMYITRAALNEVGDFDVKTFRRGYGEENDFCLRATARGWTHLLACDVFVHHEGEVSFGANSASYRASQKALGARYPDYGRIVAEHVRRDAAAPYRFALTAKLFATSGLPAILLVTHPLGGGVRRHIDTLIEKLAGRANFLLLQGGEQGDALSLPGLPGHPVLHLPAGRTEDLAALLRGFAVSRAHIHHVMGLDLELPALLRLLAVPFDFTVHDYFPICPQVNLLPWLDGQHCGEPGPADCNACIDARPNHGARDILTWRRSHDWLLRQADRVLCPSADTAARLARHGLDGRAVIAPHEPVTKGKWPLTVPQLAPRGRLRVAVIGVLAQQKGAAAVHAVAEAAPAEEYELHLIGYPEASLPTGARLRVTGAYGEAELAGLIRRIKPHVLWFPAQWPETYSYTLSAAIATGLPIVASRIGAFVERLDGRGQTWLVDPGASAVTWIETFSLARAALLSGRAPGRQRPRPARPDFYATDYLAQPAPTGEPGLTDLRRPGRLSVVAIPERFDNGAPTPCAYIRLLQPLDHPASGETINLTIATPAEALRYRADVFATQRYAIADSATADALAAHCRAHGIKLVYDLDDDLLNIPRTHPEARLLRPKARAVARMIGHADEVWVSTPQLRATLSATRTRLMGNGLDERLWNDPPPVIRAHPGPARILCMGTTTHDGDLAVIEPALTRLHEEFAGRIRIDLVGMTSRDDLPGWINRIAPPPRAIASYPGFVNWIRQGQWDIGIAPLADTGFNRSKSAIKTMDYAALGLAVLASDVPAYRGSIAGELVANTTASWVGAIGRLVRDPALRRNMAAAAHAAFLATATLAAQAPARRAAWLGLLAKTPADGISGRSQPPFSPYASGKK